MTNVKYTLLGKSCPFLGKICLYLFISHFKISVVTLTTYFVIISLYNQLFYISIKKERD